MNRPNNNGTDKPVTIFEDPFSEELWKTTYKDHNDENVDDTMRRVARFVSEAETTPELQSSWFHNFYDLLSEFKCTAGGRIYANAGTEWGGTTMLNCFVSPRANHDIDSLPAIVKDIENQAQTLKSEGGWGQNFSFIRPRGAFIHGIGVETPGAVKYMEIYDKVSDVITSGSGKKSVNKKAKGKIRKGAMMAVMDCVAGNTMISTIHGKFPIKDLVDTNPYLYCTDGNGNVFVRQAIKIWSKGIKKTIKVFFDNDDFIECTPEHEFMLSDGTFKAAKSLSCGDSLAALNKRLLNQYIHLSITGSRKVVAEHNCVYEMKYGSFPTIMGGGKRNKSSTVAHHVDHSKLNNDPSNIQSMTLEEHSSHHSDILKEYQVKRAISMKGKTWEEHYGNEQADEIRKKYISKRIGSVPWNKGMKFSQTNTNHKVLKIEESIEQEVFDVSMPNYHNFVANGVFIHNCWHPDIEEFIRAKQQPGRLTKFNMSVNCTDEFMEAVIRVLDLTTEGASQEIIDAADQWRLRFPDTSFKNYKKEWDGNLGKWEHNGYPTTTFKTISALGLWNLMMESTYNRAEPGVLFLDRANYFGPLSYAETIFATNPCGEQTLAPGGVCNLGSLNLTQFVLADGSGFDLDKVVKYVRYLNRFLDNINSLSNTPLEQYTDSMRKKRRIGIGILGWGSALFMMKIRFGSDRAAEMREEVMRLIAREAYMSSIDLAVEKGMFEYCIPEKHAEGPFIKGLDLSDGYMEKLRTTGIRNSSLLSIQPTGNTSILANVVSGGLEPIFMPEYIRTVIVGTLPDEIAGVCPKWFEGEWRETETFKLAKEGDEEILRGEFEGTVYKIDKNRGLTKEVLCQDYGVRWLAARGEWDSEADWAVTTTNLSVKDHVDDLKGFARWVDSAMSKTINVPNDYPFEDFKDIYLQTYKSGYVKGVTTYRAGTMTTVLSAKEEKHAELTDEEIILDSIKISNHGPASYSVIRAEGHKWYLTTIMDEQNIRPIALFVHTNIREPNVTTSNAVERLIQLARDKGIPEQWISDTESKIRSDNNSTKISRCISLCLRHGVLIKNIVAILDDVEDVFVGTFLFQIKKYLMTWIKDGEKVQNGECPECKAHGSFIYTEGCIKCNQCGYSKCG